jgi:acyl-CoA thioesterase II
VFTHSLHQVGEGDRWQMVWARYRGPPGAAPVIRKDNWRMHQALVTYMSDFHMVNTIMQPHARKHQNFSLVMSLDHALHFHHAVDATSWLLFHIETNASAGARGLARADVFSPAGIILASITQEGLIRVPRADAVKLAPKL